MYDNMTLATMTKAFAESGSQTSHVDNSTNHHFRTKHHKGVSSIGIQTEEINLDSLTLTQHDENGETDVGLSQLCNDSEDPLQRRLNPIRGNDFEALQAELVEWRLREENKIKSSHGSDAEKQDLVKLLLAKEAHLIRRIDDLRNVATDKSKNEKIKRVLQLMSQPKEWKGGNGDIILVDNSDTIRARDMKAMHDELNEVVEGGKRIDILQQIKVFLEQEFGHDNLAKDVNMLVERELQMLHRGSDLGLEFMEGMRTRLSNQFTKLVMREKDGRAKD